MRWASRRDRGSSVQLERQSSCFYLYRLRAVFFGQEPQIRRGREVHAASRQSLTAISLQAQIGGRQLLDRFYCHAMAPALTLFRFNREAR